jgi:ribosome-binding protein aMBF1 (putative translation factor)
VVSKILKPVVEALAHHPRRGRIQAAGLPTENASPQFVVQRLFNSFFFGHVLSSLLRPQPVRIRLRTRMLSYRSTIIQRSERIITRLLSAEKRSRNRNDQRVNDERRVAIAFGERLAQLRTDQELAQEELADRAEVHRTAIANLERGTNIPRLDTVLKLASALGVAPCQLIEGLPNWQPPKRARGRFEF